MNLRNLRTLVEIERVGSFATAADRLGLTLSAVSLQMKALEEDLQLPLFDRTHRPPAMTPVARQVSRYARTILSEVSELRAIGSEPGVLKGEYRIGFVATASVRLMPEFLAKAALEQPHAQFFVESGLSTALVHKVETGLLDAAVITATPDLRKNALFIPLHTEMLVLAAPKKMQGHDLRRCADELAHIQFTPTTGIGILVASYLKRLGIIPSATLEIDSVEAVMGCVEAGVGFAILPEPDAKRYAKTAALTPLKGDRLERTLGLAVRAKGPIAEQVDTLAKLFAEGVPAHHRVQKSKKVKSTKPGNR